MPDKRKIAIVIHGGAGPDSDYIRENIAGYKKGLRMSLAAGYKILESGGSAIDAVEEAVRSLEENYLFNAGRGSALNKNGQVEMDASIMDGANIKAGAVAMVKNVRHPVSLARLVMENTNHVLLAGNGAMEFAKNMEAELEADAYFITTHQYDLYMQERNTKSLQQMLQQKIHGTVGAVAVDVNGNVAAATSTGGHTNSLPGRIGDSCLIGAGCFANNNTCAVSATGDGEYLINSVVAHSVSTELEYTKCTLQQACNKVIHEKNKNTTGDMGVISVNANAEIGISFNSERMHRAWISSDLPAEIRIYQ
jgi:L-asparaginase / beta-aspartyl-peptidase